MITAAEAKQRTENIIEEQQTKAMEMVENEWVQFIEPKINEAINKGEYGCKYFWMASIFDEAKIDMEMFAKAFEKYGTKFGYQISGKLTTYNASNSRLDVKISWYGGVTEKCLN